MSMKRIGGLFVANLAVIYVTAVIGMWAWEGKIDADYALVLLYLWQPIGLSAAGITLTNEYIHTTHE